MKLSSISNIQVEPGIYVVYAIFDGNNTYLPKTVTWQLTVNEQATPTPARARQVTDPDYTDPTKRNPVFYFNPTTITIDETQGGTNEIDLRDYLVNSDNVSYTVTLSNGLEGVDRDIVRWDSSGTYTITVTSEASTLFNSVTSTLQISATRKQDPLIKYENGTGNIIADGNKLVRRYDYIVDYSSQFYGLQFDIELPNNPYSLPLTYSIVDTTEGTTSGTKFYPNLDIWNYSNKYRDEHGAYNKCTIRAAFEGDDTYYPATTEYEARIYVDYDDINLKRQPNLYFNNLIVNVDQNEQGEYGLQVPVNPDGLYYYYTTNQGSIEDNKLHYDGTGQATITAVIPETNTTKRWQISYTLIIREATVKVSPELSFDLSTITYTKELDGIYDLQTLNNPHNVPVTWTCSQGTITNNNTKINYSNTGNILITVTSTETEQYLPQSVTYTIVINEEVVPKENPLVVFPMRIVRIGWRQNTWTLPKVIDYDDIEVDYTVDNGATISGDTISLPDFDRDKSYDKFKITATSRATDRYNSVKATCTLVRNFNTTDGATEYILGEYCDGENGKNKNRYFTKYYVKKNDSGIYYMPHLQVIGLEPYNPLMDNTIASQLQYNTTITTSKGTASFTYVYNNVQASRVMPTITYNGTGTLLVQIKHDYNTLSFLLIITEIGKKTYNLLSPFWDYDKMNNVVVSKTFNFDSSIYHLPFNINLNYLLVWSYLDNYDYPNMDYYITSSDNNIITPLEESNRNNSTGMNNNDFVSFSSYGVRIVNSGTCTLTITIPATNSYKEIYNEKVITMNCTVNVT